MTTETTPIGAGESSPAPDGSAESALRSALRETLEALALVTLLSRIHSPDHETSKHIDGILHRSAAALRVPNSANNTNSQKA